MSKNVVTVYMWDYDHVAPLVCGDVVPEEIDLKLVLGDEAAVRAEHDPSVQVGEMDFGHYLVRLARGDRTFVGLPLFVSRNFRHRDFFVLPGSGLEALKDLEGKRVGIGGREDAATVWSRAILREQGVAMDRVQWASGSSLRARLLAGEIDALISHTPPEGFYAKGSPIVRLIGDYRRAEQEYAGRTGLYPADRIMALRRELFEADPSVARRVYATLDRSKIVSQRDRKYLGETSPWTLADVEESTALLGADWRPNGVEPNRRMIQLLCDELFAQELISKPLDPTTVFAEFERLM